MSAVTFGYFYPAEVGPSHGMTVTPTEVKSYLCSP